MIISSGGPRIRSALVMLTVAAPLAAGAQSVAAHSTSAAPATAAPAALTSTVEDDGANCPVSPPGSLTSNAKLPDPFTRIDGTRISTVSDWRCRREEILQLSEKYVYGQKAAKPASVTGTVTRTNITVNVSDNGKSASFSAGVTLPSSGSGPFPAVIVYGGIADNATIESSGAAVINYNPIDVGAEGTPRNTKQGAYYTLYGSSSSTGLLMAWAWGVGLGREPDHRRDQPIRRQYPDHLGGRHGLLAIRQGRLRGRRVRSTRRPDHADRIRYLRRPHLARHPRRKRRAAAG